MFRINTVSQDQAKGQTKEIYSIFPGPVPAPLLLMSASPALLERQAGLIKYYMSHPRLTFPLLTAIRYISSDECGHEFCMDFNRQLLMRAGMNAQEIDDLKANPATAPLEDKERDMLVFVAKAMKDPKSTNQADVDALKAQGWTDSDILDALVHGANMVASAIVFNALKQ